MLAVSREEIRVEESEWSEDREDHGLFIAITYGLPPAASINSILRWSGAHYMSSKAWRLRDASCVTRVVCLIRTKPQEDHRYR